MQQESGLKRRHDGIFWVFSSHKGGVVIGGELVDSASSSRSVLLIPSSEIVSTWCNLVPGYLLGGSVHAMAWCLGLLQYGQRLLSILYLHSAGVSCPFFWNFPLFWVALISTLGASSPEILWTWALELRCGVQSDRSESGAVYMHQFLSRSLAFLTNVPKVVG